MTFSVPRVQHDLREGRFSDMFREELGWDRLSGTHMIEVDGVSYPVLMIAQKRGVQVFECRPGESGAVPDSTIRRKIERLITKLAYEHLIVFTNADRSHQVWQWVLRQPGQPARYREHDFHKSQAGEALIQKLRASQFTISDEDGIDITDVVARLAEGFDRDKVTRRFYDDFRKRHQEFLAFIEGIRATADREWYASLMLNRLMFVYFIQQKGFLDGEPRYLQSRLEQVRARHGAGKFHTFYRQFLRRLFHEGFGQRPEERKPDMADLVGDVPYLNGGLFEEHQLEKQYPDIQVPDEAFEKLFAFFDQWTWHLDDRPLRDDKEINPDVLGYIFEKYINQKQMGAYYTKEDITGYICRSTIVPYLLDAAKKECAIAFRPDSALWRLLRDNPDCYIFEPVRRGVIDERGEIIPESALPDFVRVGMHDPKARMHDRRYNLGEAILRDAEGNKLTLPTETWREYVVRRERCLALREKLLAGEVHEINDLVTHNLDLCQFIEDAITTSEGPELLRAFYHAVRAVSVLDPTVGSGAFLFASLNILEPIYDACLDRMQAFVDDLDRSDERHSPKKFDDFRKVLADADRHPNRGYFILKSIVVNNLFGVDIMEEAVEICKLRLFLKLVSQVERVAELEPLPDIDFNIRAGNTLVGFVSIDEIRRAAESAPQAAGAVQARMLSSEDDDRIRDIEERAEVVDRAYRKFHEMQTRYDVSSAEFTAAKIDLRTRLGELADMLDGYLAGEYGIDPAKPAEYEAWRSSHEPFHWIAEFYGIIAGGGFDVIVGNPPYVEYESVKSNYAVLKYVTEPCGDLYAFVCERAVALSTGSSRNGLIIPISAFGVDGFSSLQSTLKEYMSVMWISTWSNRPAQLFEGAQKRLTIVVGQRSLNSDVSIVLTSRYYRWRREEREHLLPAVLQYVNRSTTNAVLPASLEKIGSCIEVSAFERLIKKTRPLAMDTNGLGTHKVYYTRKFGYFLSFLDRVPLVQELSTGRERQPSELKELGFTSVTKQMCAIGALSSSTFFWFWTVLSDCRNLNRRDLLVFPFNSDDLSASIRTALQHSVGVLLTELYKTSRLMIKSGLSIETFEYSSCKSRYDEIDTLLAAHYGFTDEELDFIINYDIKYRMGRDAGDAAANDGDE